MCSSIMYFYKGHTIKTDFSNPDALLPVRTKSGEFKLLTWGRRQDQLGQLPLGGWARLDAIKSGKWDQYFPKPVQLPIKQFMEVDIENKSHWYPITEGQWIQGVLAREKGERRIYIVTIMPEGIHAIHERWPRIMVGS